MNNIDVWVWMRYKNTPVVIGNEIDCHTQVSKSAWSSNSVEIGLSMFGEVKIDDNIYCLDINSSGKQICGENKESECSQDTHRWLDCRIYLSQLDQNTEFLKSTQHKNICKQMIDSDL